MTCDRPWRSARTQAAALGELRREAGRQFDPALAKEFACLVESGACEVEVDEAKESRSMAEPRTARLLFSAAPSALRSH
jgi:response regulator RpfG family c-di-GMP phosphodiesterase